MDVGDYVMTKERSNPFAKGTKLKLLAKIRFKGMVDVSGAIVEYHKGNPWHCVDQNSFEIVELVEDYVHQYTNVTFIPLFVLTKYIFDGKIILHNLCTKWDTYQSDSYEKFRREFIEKWGYDIHRNVYK